MHRSIAVAAVVALGVAGAASAQTWTEPKSGVAFPVNRDDMTLLGGGVRVKKFGGFIPVKPYAIGFYVADAALAGPLASYKTASPEFYKALHTGDFKKEVVLKFMRDLSESRVQNGMRESLAGADPKLLDQFIAYFPEVKEGQECVLRWPNPGTLEAVMAGQAKPAIADRAFAEKVLGLYVGPAPVQADIKAGVAARLGAITGAGPAVAREANGTVKAVQANGFTMTDASGRDLFFAVDNDTQIVARGAGTRMSQLRAGGKASPLSEFLAAKQTVSVKYLDSAGKLTAQEVQVR